MQIKKIVTHFKLNLDYIDLGLSEFWFSYCIYFLTPLFAAIEINTRLE